MLACGGPGKDYLIAGRGHDRLYGGAGADQFFDTECDATLMSGNGGDDYLESWWSSYIGMTCGSVNNGQADKIVGGYGDDTAKANHIDSVRAVEHVTRVTEVPF